MSDSRWLSRDEWWLRGRIVVVSNSEARDIRSYWENNAVGLTRGAWHVFSYDQTQPVAQAVAA